MAEIVKDHKGIVYKDVPEMCAKYGVSVSIYCGRLKRGLSQEEALCKPATYILQGRACKDYNGKEFSTFKAMCQYYGQDPNTVMARFYRGMLLKDALLRSTKHEERRIKDHKGMEYPTFKAMCRTYNQQDGVVKKRLDRGMSLEDALTTHGLGVEDHLGNVFARVGDMLAYYGIGWGIYNRRRRQGWGLQKTLETYSVHKNVIMHKYADILIKEKVFENDNGIYWGCTCKLCGTSGIWSCADMREHLAGCKQEVKVD